MFYKVARFVSLSVFVSDFGAVYLQSSTSHRGYKNLMAGENCLKAASCEPGVFVKTQVSEDIIVGIIKGDIHACLHSGLLLRFNNDIFCLYLHHIAVSVFRCCPLSLLPGFIIYLRCLRWCRQSQELNSFRSYQNNFYTHHRRRGHGGGTTNLKIPIPLHLTFDIFQPAN